MKKLLVLALLFISGVSCTTETERVEPVKRNTEGLTMVADNIIYDVIVQTDSDDPWEMEKVAGYTGGLMIDDLFEALYSGRLRARDYHSGEYLAEKDIRKIEKTEGFERSNIGKIQFTERWLYNTDSKRMEKDIIALVFGYNTHSEDLAGAGYMAAFEIVFE